MARTESLARASPDAANTVGLRSGQAPDGFGEIVQDSLKAHGLVDSSCCIGDSGELIEILCAALGYVEWTAESPAERGGASTGLHITR